MYLNVCLVSVRESVSFFFLYYLFCFVSKPFIIAIEMVIIRMLPSCLLRSFFMLLVMFSFFFCKFVFANSSTPDKMSKSMGHFFFAWMALTCLAYTLGHYSTLLRGNCSLWTKIRKNNLKLKTKKSVIIYSPWLFSSETHKGEFFWKNILATLTN